MAFKMKIGRVLLLTNFIIFAVQTIGRLTEWLGSGLQNRLRRFESATDLNNKPYFMQIISIIGFFIS